MKTAPAKARVLVVGGAHVDRIGVISGAVAPGASNPGSWRQRPGGGAFNAACTLSRLGHDVRLIAPRGGDELGEMVARATEAAGVTDTPVTFLDRATPTYTAILDGAGSLVIALADMALYDLFSPRQCDRRAVRDAIADAAAILIEANLPERTIAALVERAHAAGRPVAAISISPAKALRLAPVLPRLRILFMNEAEARAFCGRSSDVPAAWPDLLREKGLRAGIVTRGADPAILFDTSGAWSLAAMPVENVRDVTGAGDALAAATLSGLIDGLPLREAARRGVAAAGATVAVASSVADDLNANRLEALLPLVPQATPLH